MTGTEELEKLLLQDGYRKMESNLEQLSLYYKTTYGQTIGVLLVRPDAMPGISRAQLEHIHGQVYQALTGFGEHPVLLTLAAGAEIQRFREMFAGIPACWLWDTGSRRLIIYENQPASFYGLERKLEALSDLTEDRQNGDTYKAGGTGSTYSAGGMGYVSGSRHPAGRFGNLRVHMKRYSVVNLTIIGINVLVFLILELFGSTQDARYMAEHGAAFAPWISMYGEYYRLLTSMFLHFGIVHLGNNMLVLFVVGDRVERTLGKWKYMVLYLMSGLAGSLLSYWHAMSSGDYAVSAGASGAIFGVIGALFYIVAVNRGRMADMTMKRIGLMIAVSLYHGFTSSGVDNYAHIGGLAAGVILAAVLYRKKKQR